MAVQGLDAAFAAIIKDCQAIAVEAVKNAAKKTQKDILKEVYYKNDDLLFKTKGDNNNDFDKTPVPAENLIGIYSFKIPYVGRIGMFLQSTLGLFTCLLIPLTIVLIIDYCRNRKREMLKDKEILLLKEELKKYQNKE